jgi:hypothetical protein
MKKPAGWNAVPSGRYRVAQGRDHRPTMPTSVVAMTYVIDTRASARAISLKELTITDQMGASLGEAPVSGYHLSQAPSLPATKPRDLCSAGKPPDRCARRHVVHAKSRQPG